MDFLIKEGREDFLEALTFEQDLKAWIEFHWRKLERASEAKEMMCIVSQRGLRAYVIFVSHGAHLGGEKGSAVQQRHLSACTWLCAAPSIIEPLRLADNLMSHSRLHSQVEAEAQKS